MSKKKKVLVVDDDQDIGFLLKNFLSKKGLDVEYAQDGKKALMHFNQKHFDIVLLDFRLGEEKGSDILIELKSVKPEIPVIMITGYSDIKTAVNVMKLGALDYITKPLLPDELWHLIEKAILPQKRKKKATKKKVGKPAGKTDNFHGETYIRGESSNARDLYKQVELVAPTDFSVIISGESGTGKEAIARTIHYLSKRSSAPFVAMDCGAISKDLAGSELFGHEKGSFTGAVNAKAGHFELANSGTLFLDEIGNLSHEVQMALLRVVQERKLKRIGGTKEIDLDLRILIATNEDLKVMVNEGKFREDLFHRFNEFSLHIPPLRNRGDDIMRYAIHFLDEVKNELGKEIEDFDDEVKAIFKRYEWPGNLRELKNVIKRAALLTEGDKIEAQSLPAEISNVSEQFDSNELVQINNDKGNLKSAAREAEYEAIMKVLKSVNYNKTKAAQILNIDRKTLYNKLKQFES